MKITPATARSDRVRMGLRNPAKLRSWSARVKALWRRCRRRADQASDPRVRRSEVNLGDGGAVGGNVPRNGTEVTHSGSRKIRPSGRFRLSCLFFFLLPQADLYVREAVLCLRETLVGGELEEARGLALVLWQPAKTFHVEQP